MEINTAQGNRSVTVQQVQQPHSEQSSSVSREAEIVSSASLQAYRQQSQQQSASAADTVNLKSSSAIVKNLDTVKAIEQMHARLNDLVKGVRQTNEHLNQAAEQVSRMQGSLMTIVKNFPPYPIESMERRELLMSYMSLRKEIESLMVPPPPVPVYEKVKTMWEAMFAQNGQLQASAVPALESSSSDKQVQAASESLSRTMGELTQLSDAVTQGMLQA